MPIAARTGAPKATPCPAWCDRPHDPGEHCGAETEVVVCAGGLYETAGRDLRDDHIAVRAWACPDNGEFYVAVRHRDYALPELTPDEAEALARLLLTTAAQIRGRRGALLLTRLTRRSRS